MELTARTSIEDGSAVAWVDSDGQPWIEQPFNPETGHKWENESQALSWSNNWIVSYNNRPEQPSLSPTNI